MPHQEARAALLHQHGNLPKQRGEKLVVVRRAAVGASRRAPLVAADVEVRRPPKQVVQLDHEILDHLPRRRIRQAPVPPRIRLEHRLVLRRDVERCMIARADARERGVSEDVELRHEGDADVIRNRLQPPHLRRRHLAVLPTEPRILLAAVNAPVLEDDDIELVIGRQPNLPLDLRHALLGEPAEVKAPERKLRLVRDAKRRHRPVRRRQSAALADRNLPQRVKRMADAHESRGTDRDSLLRIGRHLVGLGLRQSPDIGRSRRAVKPKRLAEMAGEPGDGRLEFLPTA